MKNSWLKIGGLSLIFGVILTHWVSPFELSFFMKIRNIIYFKQIDHVDIRDNTQTFVYYKHINDSVYNPVLHSQLVLEDVRRILNDNVSDLYYDEDDLSAKVDTSLILRVCNSIMNKVDTIESEGFICYRFFYEMDYPRYNLDKNWHSGMAQGHAIQLMLGAYLLTSDSLFLLKAERFANLLLVDIDKGGVKEEVEGGVWFEEYAQKGGHPQPRVLNGHIFALDGLYFLSKLTQNQVYEQFLSSGIHSLESNIENYNIGYFWSYYDNLGNVANESYHQLHIEQLSRVMKLDEKNPNIRANRKLFIIGKYLPFGVFYRIVLSHNIMLLIMIVFNSILVFGLLYFISFCRKMYILK